MQDTTIITILGFIGLLIPIFRVSNKFNTNFVKLYDAIENLTQTIKELSEDRKQIQEKVAEHETRITLLERK